MDSSLVRSKPTVRRNRSTSRPMRSKRTTTICLDRKSTRLNSSHLVISYAVFCLKKKNNSARVHHFSDLNRHIPPTLALVLHSSPQHSTSPDSTDPMHSAYHHSVTSS